MVKNYSVHNQMAKDPGKLDLKLEKSIRVEFQLRTKVNVIIPAVMIRSYCNYVESISIILCFICVTLCVD